MKNLNVLYIILVLAIAAFALFNIANLPTLRQIITPSPSPKPSAQISPQPSPKTSPRPSPTPSPQTQNKTVNLNESFTVRVGDVVEISGTGLVIKITVIAYAYPQAAYPPEEGTGYDAPSRLELEATYQGRTENLLFSIGGNATEEVVNRNRQKDVFGTFNIYVQKLTVTEATLIVKRI